MELNQTEIKALEFHDEKVQSVVLQAVEQGASVVKKDDNTIIFYDPYYSSNEIAIDRLRYNSELGLYHE